MSRRWVLPVVAGLVIAALIAVILVSIARSRNTPPSGPGATFEQEDCDAEDRRNREVEDCGIGVLVPTPRVTTRPPTKPPTTRPPSRPTPSPRRTR